MFGKNVLTPAAGGSESGAIAALKRQLELAGVECSFTPADTVELPVSELPGTAINRLPKDYSYMYLIRQGFCPESFTSLCRFLKWSM